MLQTLTDLYRLNPVIIKDIKKSKGITGSLKDMTVTQLETFIEEAQSRYDFAVNNGYVALPSKDTPVGSYAITTKGKAQKIFKSDIKSGAKYVSQIIQDRVPKKIKELFISYDMEKTNIQEKYKKKALKYVEMIKSMTNHKLTNEQQMLLNSRFGDGKNNVELRGLIHAIHANLFYPGQTDNKYIDMLYDLGDILGYDTRKEYTEIKELVFDSIYADTISQNIDTKYVNLFFPRQVRNDIPQEDYINAIKRQLEKKFHKPYNELDQSIKK
jgi:hypothetical protein